MFEQVVGDGANLFITILAVIVGFVNALAYVDYQKVKKQQDSEQH